MISCAGMAICIKTTQVQCSQLVLVEQLATAGQRAQKDLDTFMKGQAANCGLHTLLGEWMATCNIRYGERYYYTHLMLHRHRQWSALEIPPYVFVPLWLSHSEVYHRTMALRTMCMFLVYCLLNLHCMIPYDYSVVDNEYIVFWVENSSSKQASNHSSYFKTDLLKNILLMIAGYYFMFCEGHLE